MTSRRDKIEALLSSPNEGERAAAQAALGRVSESRPKKGSPEWREAVRAWNGKIDFCLARLGLPGLSRQEARSIRNLAKNRGTPWSRGAENLLPIHRKLMAADEAATNSDLKEVRLIP